jgi:hypothetical protein
MTRQSRFMITKINMELICLFSIYLAHCRRVRTFDLVSGRVRYVAKSDELASSCLSVRPFVSMV